MRSCRTASIGAMAALLAASAVASCREAASPDVPPVTSALAPPSARGPERLPVASAALTAPTTAAPPLIASFVDVPGTVDAPICSRLMIALAKGKATALGETPVAEHIHTGSWEILAAVEASGSFAIDGSASSPSPRSSWTPAAEA